MLLNDNTHVHTHTQSISSSRVYKAILTSPLAVTLSVILVRAVCRLRTFKSSADGETLSDAKIRFSTGTHTLKRPYLSYPPVVCLWWVLIIIYMILWYLCHALLLLWFIQYKVAKIVRCGSVSQSWCLVFSFLCHPMHFCTNASGLLISWWAESDF